MLVSFPTIIHTVSDLSTLSTFSTGVIIKNDVGKTDSDFTSLEFNKLRFLTQIEIGDNCFQHVRIFVIDGLKSLESVKIGDNCFGIGDEQRDDGVCRITNCSNLHQLEIGDYSFRDFKSFELSNVNSLRSITFGGSCFRYADFSLKGRIILISVINKNLDIFTLKHISFKGSFENCHIALFESILLNCC